MKHWKLSILLGSLYGLLTFYFSYALLNGMIGIWKGTLLFYVIVIPFCVLGIYYARKKDRGYLSFREAFLICLGIIIIGVFSSQVIYAIYIANIDDQEQDRMMDLVVENQLAMVEYMKVDELEFEDQLRAQMKGMFEINAITITTSLLSILIMSIFGVIISLIMRRERPDALA